MFTLCFTKAEGQVGAILQNAGLNSATPSSCSPYFGNTPPCAFALHKVYNCTQHDNPAVQKKERA